MNKNRLLRFLCVLPLSPCRVGAVSTRFQRVSALSLSSVYSLFKVGNSSGEALQIGRRKSVVNASMITSRFHVEHVRQLLLLLLPFMEEIQKRPPSCNVSANLKSIYLRDPWNDALIVCSAVHRLKRA